MNQGLLDRARFEPSVWKAWAALASCVDPDGKSIYVVADRAREFPKKFSEGATEVYGTGAFLLAGSEVYRLAVLEEDSGSDEITVTNPSSCFRAQETVETAVGQFGSAGAVVMDGLSSRIIDSQVYDPMQGDSPARSGFKVDLAPNETRHFTILHRGSGLGALPPPRSLRRRPPGAERFNDVAWESDRIAHRTYSQGLIKGEGTVSSGIDVGVKRTRSLVIDGWYRAELPRGRGQRAGRLRGRPEQGLRQV